MTYGVPFMDSDGEFCRPDMLRVLLDNGVAAYVSAVELDEMLSQTVCDLDYDDEVLFFADEINELFCGNVVSFDEARDFIDGFKRSGSVWSVDGDLLFFR